MVRRFCSLVVLSLVVTLGQVSVPMGAEAALSGPVSAVDDDRALVNTAGLLGGLPEPVAAADRGRRSRASLPPGSDTPLELEVGSSEALAGLLTAAGSHETDRGVPAVELVDSDESTLVIGQTRLGAVLLLIDSLGESFHGVGSGTLADDTVVPFDLGRAAALAFLNGDHPATAGLTMEPD